MLKNTIRFLLDILLIPFIFLAAVTFKLAKRIKLHYLPICKKILLKVGVYPVVDHYYEPLFDKKHLKKDLFEKRNLVNVDFNLSGQLSLLSQLNYSLELENVREDYESDSIYNFKNGSFEHGDGEFLYNLVRLKKPTKIIEIGSGHSTKITQLAIKNNKLENPKYNCNHICIEPYEMPWLEKLDITVLRQRVEEISASFFEQLEENDLLFIDSSHMIRPQGDVLYEYLEILPVIKKGVIVHIHDIFTPRDYPYLWVIEEVRFWNEQYLLEAFLGSNQDWTVIGMLNLLYHEHFEHLKFKMPRLKEGINPGSFYMVKN